MDLDLTIEGTGEPRPLYAKGRNVLVWMDYGRGKSAAWPQRLLDALGEVTRADAR